MKKLFATALVLGMMLLTTTAFAAEPVPDTFVCPNGNATCISNGACINDGACQYPEGCPNGGVPKRDGTGGHHGGRGQGRGNRGGHCGR